MSVRGKIFGILIALVFAFPALTSAMHIIGGEITYEYLGPGATAGTNKYRFTMKIYRDCNSGGAPLDNLASFAIYRGSYSNNTLFASYVNNNRIPLSSSGFIQPDTPKCVQEIPDVCVQQGLYTFMRDLLIQSKLFHCFTSAAAATTAFPISASAGDVFPLFCPKSPPLAQQVQQQPGF